MLRPNQVVRTERLLIDLWGADAPPATRKNLHTLVHRLRRSLGDNRVVRRGDGYLLRVESGELDVEVFEHARAEAASLLARGDHALAAESFRHALALWRGSPLADLREEPFAHAEAERLEELRLTTLEDRIDAELTDGRHADLVAELRSVVAEHPLRERLCGQLMVALYRSGRQSEALEEYRRVRDILHRDLGLDPARRLRELEQAILRQDPALDALARPAVSSSSEPEDRGRPTATRSRRLVLSATALLAASLVAALVVAFGTDGTEHALAGVEPNSVGVIDPEQNALIDEVPVGQRPIGVVVGAGAVWVANEEDGTVSRISPVDMAVSKNIRARTEFGAVAAGRSRVWVVGNSEKRGAAYKVAVSGIDPQFNAVTTSVRFSSATVRFEQIVGVTADQRAVWVAASWRLLRLSPNGRLVGAIEEFSNISDLDVGAGAVWVADIAQPAAGSIGGSSVLRVDPRTNAISARVTVADEPSGVAVGEGAVWIASDNGTVTRIDPESNVVAATIELGGALSDVAVGEGAVWVANSAERNVVRIDPKTNEVVATIPTRTRPDSIAVGAGKVWVTAY